jgi:hypothetical protein
MINIDDLLSLGSMVQKGKFSAVAELFVNTLKNVDFLKSKKITANDISPDKIKRFDNVILFDFKSQR